MYELNESTCRTCGRMSIVIANGRYNEMFLEQSTDLTNELNTKKKQLRYLHEIEQACGNKFITIRKIMSSRIYHSTSTEYKWLKKYKEQLGNSTTLKKLREFIIYNT